MAPRNAPTGVISANSGAMISARIAQQRLETRARNRKRRAHQNAQQDSRQAQIENNHAIFRRQLVSLADGDSAEVHDQIGDRDGHRAQLQREQHARQQQQTQSTAGQQQSPECQRAHRQASSVTGLETE
jgi:hypothetical protein